MAKVVIVLCTLNLANTVEVSFSNLSQLNGIHLMLPGSPTIAIKVAQKAILSLPATLILTLFPKVLLLLSLTP